MNIKRISTALSLTFIVGTAVPVTSSAAANDWAGLYVGAHAGYGMDKDVSLDFPSGNSSGNFDMTGYVAGIQGGYNWAVSGLVMGVEADASAADVNGDTSCPSPGGTCKATMDQLYTLQGRIGIPMNKFLVYGSLGAASGQIEAKTERPAGTFSDSSHQTGWLVGLGGAMAFNEHWNGLVELQYLDFGSNNYTLGSSNVSVDSKFLTLKVGANWKF